MPTLLLWIVFAGDIRALGSHDYYEREAAEARLTKWCALAYPLLDRKFDDLEVARRVQRIRYQGIPVHLPPIGVLAGKPTFEWAKGTVSYIGPRPEGADWQLMWIKPDVQKSQPLRYVIVHYGERARTQFRWADWQSDEDSREAMRLLVCDLTKAGVPTPFIRILLDYVRQREP